MKNKNKKLLFLILLCVTVAIVIYLFDRNKSSTNIDSTVSENDNRSICEKQIESQPDSNIEMFNGISKAVDFTAFPEAKNYYTVITKSVKLGSNFAGHFTLTRWGCGTDTISYSIVDNKTGSVVAYNGCESNYHLRNYSLDSRVLVLDPVYAGQDRKFYEIVEQSDGKSKLELTCTETSTEDMYGSPE